jgi:hypothetical protein
MNQFFQTELDATKSNCVKEGKTLVTRLGIAERKISNSIRSVTARLSVCEQNLEQMKAQSAQQSETIVTLSNSLSLLSQRMSVCEQSFPEMKGALRAIWSRLSACGQRLEQVRLTTLNKETKCPLNDGWFSNTDPLDGIISHLTRRCGGNVHEKQIVNITSKSMICDSLQNPADLTVDSFFQSKDEQGQWICWDFRDTIVRPTHYTIKGCLLISWVLEGSLDGKLWTEMHRRASTSDFSVGHLNAKIASFAVSNSADCRFIRLTQTGKNHYGTDYLVIHAFEVFGTLLE